jgi:hypothetical protein
MSVLATTIRPENQARLRWERAPKPGVVFALRSAAGLHAELDVRDEKTASASFFGAGGAVKRRWRFTKDTGFFGGDVKISSEDGGAALKATVGTFGGADLTLPDGRVVSWENADSGEHRHWVPAEGDRISILQLETKPIQTRPCALTIMDSGHPHLALLIVTGWYLAYIEAMARGPETLLGVGVAALTATAMAAAVVEPAAAQVVAATARKDESTTDAAGTVLDAAGTVLDAADIVSGLFSLFE